MEREALNGWYDKSDGSIHIDLNAGDGGNTLFTLSHEFTHFIEQWSKEKYKQQHQLRRTHIDGQCC